MSPSTDTTENRAFACELKFVVPPKLAEAVREWTRDRLVSDPHGTGPGGDTYSTSSLYFDTAAFDVYRKTRSFRRSKYRVRRYCDGPVVFLERKLKTRDLVSKRRSIVDLSNLARIADSQAEKDWLGFWFHRRLLARDLRPVCQISYERTARVLMTPNGPIRLTLDRDLRAFTVDSPEFRREEQGVPINGDDQILELKFRRAIPSVFKQLMSEFGLNQRPVSKYRMAVEALGCVQRESAVAFTA